MTFIRDLSYAADFFFLMVSKQKFLVYFSRENTFSLERNWRESICGLNRLA